MSDIDAEVFVKAATKHGEDSEPDHEVGDLQDYFRAAFRLLTPEQKEAFLATAEVQDSLACACPEAVGDEQAPRRVYALVAADLEAGTKAVPGPG